MSENNGGSVWAVAVQRALKVCVCVCVGNCRVAEINRRQSYGKRRRIRGEEESE